MSCPRCTHLCQSLRQTTPDQLKHFIGYVHEQVRAGVVAESGRPLGCDYLDPFDSLPAAGPWLDGFGYYLACLACGQRFTFEAETYHGLGGNWDPTNPDA